jgi:hypothetical protein
VVSLGKGSHGGGSRGKPWRRGWGSPGGGAWGTPEEAPEVGGPQEGGDGGG